jgi:hypothetical protein
LIALRFLQGGLFAMLPQTPAAGGDDSTYTAAALAEAMPFNLKEVSP